MAHEAHVSPGAWRKSAELSFARAAQSVGIEGKAAGRTWERYEKGERVPPLTIIEEVQKLSKGRVTLRSWIDVRKSYEHGRAA